MTLSLHRRQPSQPWRRRRHVRRATVAAGFAARWCCDVRTAGRRRGQGGGRRPGWLQAHRRGVIGAVMVRPVRHVGARRRRSRRLWRLQLRELVQPWAAERLLRRWACSRIMLEQITDEVARAQRDGAPAVALEARTRRNCVRRRPEWEVPRDQHKPVEGRGDGRGVSGGAEGGRAQRVDVRGRRQNGRSGTGAHVVMPAAQMSAAVEKAWPWRTSGGE